MSNKISFTILSVLFLSFQITAAVTIDRTQTVDTLAPGGTYIITSGSTSTNTYTPELSPEVAVWDTDNSGTISKMEALAAVADYFKPGGISKANALAVVAAYFNQP